MTPKYLGDIGSRYYENVVFVAFPKLSFIVMPMKKSEITWNNLNKNKIWNNQVAGMLSSPLTLLLSHCFLVLTHQSVFVFYLHSTLNQLEEVTFSDVLSNWCPLGTLPMTRDPKCFSTMNKCNWNISADIFSGLPQNIHGCKGHSRNDEEKLSFLVSSVLLSHGS